MDASITLPPELVTRASLLKRAAVAGRMPCYLCGGIIDPDAGWCTCTPDPGPDAERAPWQTERLYRRVEEAAIAGDATAVLELGRRYALDVAPYATPAFHGRLQRQYVLGYTGQPDPFGRGRGGNFAASLRTAHRAGARRRAEHDALGGAK